MMVDRIGKNKYRVRDGKGLDVAIVAESVSDARRRAVQGDGIPYDANVAKTKLSAPEPEALEVEDMSASAD